MPADKAIFDSPKTAIQTDLPKRFCLSFAIRLSCSRRIVVWRTLLQNWKRRGQDLRQLCVYFHFAVVFAIFSHYAKFTNFSDS